MFNMKDILIVKLNKGQYNKCLTKGYLMAGAVVYSVQGRTIVIKDSIALSNKGPAFEYYMCTV